MGRPNRQSRPAEGSNRATEHRVGRADSILPPYNSPVWERLADRALTNGKSARAVIGGVQIVAVTDLVIAESVANGLPDPIAPTIERSDGRTVRFFRWTPSGGGRRG